MNKQKDAHNRLIEVPCKLVLDRYYELFLEGKEQKDIAKEMAERPYNVTPNDWDQYMGCFTSYARYRMQFETKENLEKNLQAIRIPLTPELRAQFLDLVSHGVSIAKATRAMNIPVITVYDYWYMIDPLLRVEVETAVDMLDAKITRSFAKRALGYRTKSRTKTKTSGIGADGRPVDLEVESESDSEVAPDAGAGKFWLINRTPEKFSLDGNANKTENKGTILEFIDNELAKAADNVTEKVERQPTDEESDDF